MLNRGIFAGILIIIALVGIILAVKACRNQGSEGNVATGESNTAESITNNVIENTTPDEETTTPENMDYTNDGQRIVCLDAGHGGEDPGSEGTDGVLEKDDTLKMAKAIQKELESRGITVYMTREDDSWVTKDERVNLANSVNADLFVSIHRNEYRADVNVKGFETWVHSSKPADAADAAERIQAALTQAGITRDRGVKFGSQGSEEEDYYINNHSKGPSCLLEMGFMTNSEDNSLFRNKTDVLADAIAQAIEDWLDAQGL